MDKVTGDLVARLRHEHHGDLNTTRAEAADRIEALEARVAQAETLRNEAMQAHGEALSRIEDYIRQIDERDSALAAEREAHERTKAHYKATAEGVMQCIDASWGMNKGRDWSRPELVLAEYVGELREALARADALLKSVEWGGNQNGYVANCPICFKFPSEGHADDCALAAYLRDREGGAA